MTRNEAMAKVKANPTDPHAWLDLAALLAMEGAIREAKESYKRALLLDPSSEEAQAALQAFADAPSPERARPAQPQEAPARAPAAPEVPPAGEDSQLETPPEWLLVMRERATEMADDEEPEGLGGAPLPAVEEEDTAIDSPDGDWVHVMRERIGDDKSPPPLPSSGRINKRRLLLVLALPMLCLLATCAWVARDAGWWSGAASQEASGMIATVPPLAPSESPPPVATWTPRPSSTPRPTNTPRPSRTATPPVTATLEPTAAAQQEYRAFLEEVQTQYTPALQQLRELVATARDNPALLEDSQWRLEMSTNIALVQFVTRKIVEKVPPESYQGFHQELITAAQSYESAMSAFDNAIAERSMERLGEADLLMSSATLAISRLSPP